MNWIIVGAVAVAIVAAGVHELRWWRSHLRLPAPQRARHLKARRRQLRKTDVFGYISLEKWLGPVCLAMLLLAAAMCLALMQWLYAVVFAVFAALQYGAWRLSRWVYPSHRSRRHRSDMRDPIE